MLSKGRNTAKRTLDKREESKDESSPTPIATVSLERRGQQTPCDQRRQRTEAQDTVALVERGSPARGNRLQRRNSRHDHYHAIEHPSTSEILSGSVQEEEEKVGAGQTLQKIEGMVRAALRKGKLNINTNQLETELSEIFERHQR